MENIIKSIVVFVILLGLVLVSVISIMSCKKQHQTNKLTKIHLFTTVICCCVTLLSVFLFCDYINPFERTVHPVLIAEFEVGKEYELDYAGQKFWHGAYEQYGLYAESFYFDPDNTQSVYGFGWPPMDFDKHNYIITYGQTIQKLTYNVWDTIDEPIKTGAKVGHMILNDDFSPSKVYIYQIPKIRIENDVNNLDRKWD